MTRSHITATITATIAASLAAIALTVGIVTPATANPAPHPAALYSIAAQTPYFYPSTSWYTPNQIRFDVISNVPTTVTIRFQAPYVTRIPHIYVYRNVTAGRTTVAIPVNRQQVTYGISVFDRYGNRLSSASGFYWAP